MKSSSKLIQPADPKTALDKFEQFLRSEGLSMTRPRRTIAELAFKAGEHFSAQELLKWVKAKDPFIGKVTVYRTLVLLVKSGLLAERDFIRDRMHYEPVLGRPHHEHMICIVCGRIIEFINEDIERLQELVARKHGFEIVHHIHKLFGYCSDCRRRSKK